MTGLVPLIRTGRAAVLETLAGLGHLDHGPFQTAAWLAAWHDAFGTEHDLVLACLTEPSSGRIVFALPLATAREDGLDLLVAPDCGFTDYNGALVDPATDIDPEDLRNLLSNLHQTVGGADAVIVEKIPPMPGGSTNPLATIGRWSPSPFQAHPVYLDGVSDISALVNPSLIRSLEKKSRKLENRGNLTFVLYRGAEADRAADLVRRWRSERFGDAVCPLADTAGARLYGALCATGVAFSGLVLSGGEPIGGTFGIIEGSGAHLLMVGHARAFANYSPGMLAIVRSMDWARREGLALFDFTIGSESYKRDLGATPVPLADLYYPLTARGTLRLVVRRTVAFLRATRNAGRRIFSEAA